MDLASDHTYNDHPLDMNPSRSYSSPMLRAATYAYYYYYATRTTGRSLRTR